MKNAGHVKRGIQKITRHFVGLSTTRHGESFISLPSSIDDVLLVICVRLPLPSLQRGTTPMCPGGNGMRQLSIFLIIPRILLALMIFLLNPSFPRYNAIFSEISCVIFVSLHRLVISACLRICIDVCSTESCLMPNAALLFL